MIAFEKVSHDWGEFSLKDVTFSVAEGEYFVILGPTGAGKTLILETIAGFYIPREGHILLNRKDATHIPPEKRNIGFVYQDYSLFPHMTVEENVAFGLKMHRTPKKMVEQRVQEIMETLQINHLKERFPTTLSGGEQQRTALARALVINPTVLLLDEPLSALDPRTRENLRDELKRIHKIHGTTTIHVTHDQTEALALADRIAVIINGKVVQVDESYKVFNEPSSVEVASFVGVENVLKGRILSNKNGVASIDVGKYKVHVLSNLVEGDVNVFVRPENIILSKNKSKSSARNVIEGKIIDVTPFGPVFRISIDNGLSAFVTKQSVEELELKTGETVYASFKATAAHLVKR
jgi:molybdate/tungstate transport system ATP-binding protein